MSTSRVVVGLCAVLSVVAVARGDAEPLGPDVLFRVTEARPDPGLDEGTRYELRIGAVRSIRDVGGRDMERIRLRDSGSGGIDRTWHSQTKMGVLVGGRWIESVATGVSAGTAWHVSIAPGRWSNGALTLAYQFEETRRRADISKRVHEGQIDPDEQTTVVAPAFDRVVATGAGDLWVGKWAALAEVPDHDGDVRTIFARIDRVADPGSTGGGESAPGLAAMATLARDPAALRGRLRVTPLLRGTNADAPEAAQTSLQIEGTLVPGVAVARLLDEVYLSDYDVEVAQCSFVCEAIPRVQTSGLHVAIVSENSLRLAWTMSLPMGWFETTLGEFTSPVAIEIPDARHFEVTIPIEPGRRVVPIATLDDGRSAAIAVEFIPAR